MLPKGPRNLWDTAKTRDFSIGVQAALLPSSHDVLLTQETVAIAASPEARIVLTVYAPVDLKKKVSKNGATP
jgi:hypothetical protein